MKRFKYSLVAKIVLASIMMFLTLYFTLDWQQLQQVTAMSVLGIVGVVWLRWLPHAFNALRGGREGYAFLIVGIFSFVFNVFILYLWTIYFRSMGRPQDLLELPVSSAIAWSFATSGVLIILAQDTEAGNIPQANFYWLIIAAFLSGCIMTYSLLSVPFGAIWY